MSLATNKPATAAKQDTGNQTLADILAKIITAPATDSKLEAVRALLAGNLYAVAPPPASSTVTIGSGNSLSGALQIDGKMAGIIMPATWTSAAVTFTGSTDGTNYYPIYDAGIERTIAASDAIAGRLIVLSLSDWLGVKYVKIRSGTAGSPANQAADRVITVLKVA